MRESDHIAQGLHPWDFSCLLLFIPLQTMPEQAGKTVWFLFKVQKTLYCLYFYLFVFMIVFITMKKI